MPVESNTVTCSSDWRLELPADHLADHARNVALGEKLEAIVSVHHLGTPRAWMEEEIAAARQAASRVGEFL